MCPGAAFIAKVAARARLGGGPEGAGEVREANGAIGADWV